MPKVLSIIIEHLYEKRWIFLMFGILVGLMGFLLTMIVEVIDISAYTAIIESMPEFADFFGGLDAFSSPYGFVNVEMFTFMWIFVGIFLVYMTSSTALPTEIENKTIDLILSKPVSRSTYLAGKIGFLYLFIVGLMGIVLAFVGMGMATSQEFIDYGLYWDRLLAVYIINIVHLGTLVMTALLFATIFLNSKKTMGAALAVMFLMFFIGSFWTYFPEAYESIKYVSTWFYLNTADLFGRGIFDDFLRDILVLISVNVSLIIASLLIFRRRDIPV
ncbi:MAG: ABC transporter permease subunit [Candidatus Thorarchaeota archaeon]